jgi:hypothetical protein
MPALDEQFYETAARELAENQYSQAIWAKAFRLAKADVQKAKALYIKLRVEQLERETPRSAAQVILDAWPAITNKQVFVCPYCGALTTAVHQLWVSSGRHRYLCRACKKELSIEVPHAQSTNAVKGSGPLTPAISSPHVFKHNNPWALWGFITGLVSIFFFWIGIIPLAGLGLSVAGLTSFKPETQKNKWMAGVGLALSILYTLAYMGHYGHLRS